MATTTSRLNCAPWMVGDRGPTLSPQRGGAVRSRMRGWPWRPLEIALVVSACTSSGGSGEKSGHGWFEARPLIMPGRHTTPGHGNPFASLRVPASEYAFYSLRPAQQAALAAALRAVDCAHPPRLAGSADRVVCDADSDAYLLGPALFHRQRCEGCTTARTIRRHRRLAGLDVADNARACQPACTGGRRGTT